MPGGLPKPSWGDDQADRLKMDSPLFENLDAETFIELLQRCRRRAFSKGEVLIRQGAAARSFFVLINGSLKVIQGPLEEPDAQIELARLSPRDFFGEMALVSRSPRMASVIATSDGEALEFPDVILEKLVARSPEAKAALEDFIRARLLQNAMASSAIFRPFNRAQRRHLFARFAITEVPGGTSLLTQGRPADGFYVIMEGSFRVDRDGEMLSAFSVGDTFGEISLLTHSPATASVIAEVPGRVLRLPSSVFHNLVAKHPDVERYAKEIDTPRTKDARHVSVDKIPSDTAGLVLV
jgi:CRP-like cAMP-binding protein